MKNQEPSQALATIPTGPPASVAPDVATMLQAVLAKGVTGENVAAVEKIIDLYERMQSRDAEKAFATAFNALQSEMPRIQASRAVPGKDGKAKYHFAPYEDLMEQVRPLLLKHGFSLSFSTRYDGNRIVKVCELSHTGGHKRSNEFAVRIGSGPPGASETQADGAAGTYAKRFALCDALNIVVERDTDGDPRTEGAPITPEQAQELRRRVRETASDEALFLKFAGAATYEEISSSKYDVLDQSLARKEKTR